MYDAKCCFRSNGLVVIRSGNKFIINIHSDNHINLPCSKHNWSSISCYCKIAVITNNVKIDESLGYLIKWDYTDGYYDFDNFRLNIIEYQKITRSKHSKKYCRNNKFMNVTNDIDINKFIESNINKTNQINQISTDKNINMKIQHDEICISGFYREIITTIKNTTTIKNINSTKIYSTLKFVDGFLINKRITIKNKKPIETYYMNEECSIIYIEMIKNKKLKRKIICC